MQRDGLCGIGRQFSSGLGYCRVTRYRAELTSVANFTFQRLSKHSFPLISVKRDNTALFWTSQGRKVSHHCKETNEGCPFVIGCLFPRKNKSSYVKKYSAIVSPLLKNSWTFVEPEDSLPCSEEHPLFPVDRKSWWSGLHSCFIFGSSRVQISARRQAVHPKGFLSPPGECRHSTLKLGHDRFLPSPFQFVIHLPPLQSTLYSLSHWKINYCKRKTEGMEYIYRERDRRKDC
jgi:hypothetical protein